MLSRQWTSEHEGGAYVQTANLDGETDLKARVAVPATQVRWSNVVVVKR